MNDAFYEQLVTRKTKPLDILIRILIIVFIAAVAVVGTLFIGFLAFSLPYFWQWAHTILFSRVSMSNMSIRF